MKTILKAIPKPIIIIVAICFALLYSFLAYLLVTSNSNQQEVSDPNAIYTEAAAAVFAGMTETASNPDSSLGIEATAAPEQSSSEIFVDKNLLDVEITLPASMFADTDISTFDTEVYVKENGFKKAVVNDDGSITVTMSKSKHNELMEEYATDLETMFAEYIGAEYTSYISNITNDSNFSEIVIDVDRAGYESTVDLTPLSIGFSAMFYQSLAGIDPHCEIIIRDRATGETITSVIYPDAFEQ